MEFVGKPVVAMLYGSYFLIKAIRLVSWIKKRFGRYEWNSYFGFHLSITSTQWLSVLRYSECYFFHVTDHVSNNYCLCDFCCRRLGVKEKAVTTCWMMRNWVLFQLSTTMNVNKIQLIVIKRWTIWWNLVSLFTTAWKSHVISF